ncbi:MAG: M16 family metallopeptidase [Parachlamydiaceae bacterium]
MISNLFCFFLPLACYVSFIHAEELYQSESYLGTIQTTDMTLNNGMRVFLRPNRNLEEEVTVQLAAVGGYSSFPEEEQAALRIASKVIMESGIGSMSSDQLSALLYNYSIELDTAIKPFYRLVTAECGNDSLPMLLKIISSFLTEPRFTQQGLEATRKTVCDAIDQSNLNKTKKFENAFFSLNTQTSPRKITLTKDCLENISVELLSKVFEKAFANPQDFCCVITGNFDVKIVKPYVIRFLGGIPQKSSKVDVKISNPPCFPLKPQTHFVTLKNSCDSISRITYPIIIPIDSTNIFKLEMLCQTMEAHLKSTLQRRFKSSYALNVAFEFPYYPSFAFPWITVQFRCPFPQADHVSQVITTEVNQLKNKGPQSNDLRWAEQNQKTNEDFWHKEDEYWASFITHAFLMGLSPEAIFLNQRESKNITLEKMKMNLSTFFDATRYTRLTTKPE